MIKFFPLRQVHWKHVSESLNITLKEDTRGVVAMDVEKGEIAGAVVCEDWSPTSVWCHILIDDRAALRAGLHLELARYVFHVAGRQVIYGKVAADNDPCLKLCKKWGFREVARLEEAYDVGIDQVIIELRLENSPYQHQVKAA